MSMVFDKKEKPVNDDSSDSGSDDSHDYVDRSTKEVRPPSYFPGGPPANAPTAAAYGAAPGPYAVPSSSVMPQFAANNISQTPTNGLYVSTNRDDVTGTWYLDPLLPTQIHMNQRGDKRERRHGGHRVESTTPPSATFDSRNGNLNATLAIVGTPQPARAGIVATTRHGHVKINLISKAPGKFVDIDVYSRHGQIVVLVPRSFVGVLELRARRGNILTMPSLASVAQVVQSTEDKVVLRLGQGVQVPAGIPEDHGRFYTRSGNISVGFSGEDDSHALPPPSAARTMLKKMTGFGVVFIFLRRSCPLTCLLGNDVQCM